jgi:hypothetical protein
MESTGPKESLSLSFPLDDHGFFDFCFYVVRNHQLNVEINHLKEDKNINKSSDNICFKLEEPIVCGSGGNVKNLDVCGNLCCFEEILNSSFCLEQDVEMKSKKETALAATAFSSREPLTMREKFDSAASQNFYGNRDCLSIVSDESPIFIEGFTADHQAVSSEGGLNVDGKRSFYVSGMPEELALLSAYLYVQDGAALLFPSEGVVLKLSAKELQSLTLSRPSFFPHMG